jgi:phosphoadenosine phosphosulfate reductase
MLEEKIERSKKILKLAAEMSKTYYDAPLIITYSGGKDSDVLLSLARESISPEDFVVWNAHTTVDAPPTVYHIESVFEELRKRGIETEVKQYRYPEVEGDKYSDYRKSLNGKSATMWNLIPAKRMPPTRLARYCCAVLKETGTPNRMAALGVRAAESPKRQGRDVFGVRGGVIQASYIFFV